MKDKTFQVTDAFVKKNAPPIWKEISDYLELGISWETINSRITEETKNLGPNLNESGLIFERGEGWSIQKGQIDGKYFFKLTHPEKAWDEYDAKSKIKHELTHAYQHMFQPNFNEIDPKLRHPYREAIAKVMQHKDIGCENYMQKHGIDEKDVNTLMKKFWEMSHREFKENVRIAETKSKHELEEHIKRMLF